MYYCPQCLACVEGKEEGNVWLGKKLICEFCGRDL